MTQQTGVSSGLRTIMSAETHGEKTIIRYSDNSTETFESQDKVKSFPAEPTPITRSPSGYPSPSTTTGGSAHTYRQQTFSVSMPPTKAFTFTDDGREIQFWGCAKYKLDDMKFQKGDLIINCTGSIWNYVKPAPPKTFLISGPNWLKLPTIYLEDKKPDNCGNLAEQMVLEWPDFSSPSSQVDMAFWESIIEQSLDKKITRIICCCGAGQGRTGTALASFLLATGAVDEPDTAIDYIRKNYSDKAIENASQEKYIFHLLYVPVPVKAK